MQKKTQAFSLVEVVVAVGIFAIAIVSILGLLLPITQSIKAVSDGDSAARLLSILQPELQREARRDWASFSSHLNGTSKLYFSREGKLHINNVQEVPREERFFVITLKENSAISGGASGSTYAFNVILKWPAFLPNATKDADEITDSKFQDVLIAPTVVLR